MKIRIDKSFESDTKKRLSNINDSHKRISIEGYKQELDQANNRIESGYFLSQYHVRKEAQSWMR